MHPKIIFLDLIDGALKQGVSSGQLDDETYSHWEFKEQDELLSAVRDRRNICTSKLRVLGLTKVADILLDVVKVEVAARDYIVFEKTLPDDNQLNDLCVRYYERRDEFYRLIESEFKSTYS